MKSSLSRGALKPCATILFVSSFSILLSSCSSSSSSGDSESFNVSGALLGLDGELVVQNANEPSTSLTLDGDIELASNIPAGTEYNIQVVSQPAQQFCEVINGSGTVESDIDNIRIYCNYLHYFVANNLDVFDYDYELWVSNGTTAGTHRVKDINPTGSSMYLTQQVLRFADASYFTANDGSNGAELWKTDGSEDGTSMVVDLNSTGNQNSTPSTLTVVNNHLLFNAFNGSEGSTLSHSMNQQDQVSTLSVTTLSDNQDKHDNELLVESWSIFLGAMAVHTSDGTTLSTKSFNGVSMENPHRLKVVGDKVFSFMPSGPNNYLLRVANVDGSSTPLVLASFNDIDTSNISPSTQSTDQAIAFNGKLFFNADDGSHGHTLWMSDGTVEGTQMVKDLDNSIGDTEVHALTLLGDKLAFLARGSAHGLWVTDGTEAGTQQLTSTTIITSSMAGDATPVSAPLTTNNHRLFFAALDTEHGTELWSSDGTAEGTTMVKDIFPGSSSSMPIRFIARNGYVLFGAIGSSEQNMELWRSDGTEEGTFIVKDICTADSCGSLLAAPAG